MPEAPPQAHALVPAEDDLAAHLADREVEQGVVARLAGQAGTAPHHFWRAGWVGGLRPLRAPAERAEERVRPRRGRDAAWCVGEGVVVSTASSKPGRVYTTYTTGRGSTV